MTEVSQGGLRAALEEALATIEELTEASNEPIAIIGMGCRFPGGVTDPESYWGLLRGGVDAIREVPADRWNIDAVYDPNPAAPGKMSTRFAGFVGDVDRFDAAFFGISPREAASMDPQQRLLLEVTWEALENSGYDPGRLASSATGVFIGFMTSEYGTLVQGGDLSRFDAMALMGNLTSAVAGRLSYVLGLQGPSLVVDTACSSSLVAVHLACQSLRSGDCEMALVGGVGLLLTPGPQVGFSRMGGNSPDGRCKAFAASANGMGWGEGCGMLVLRRLSDARAHGDRILAVIRGSAVNQDGRSNGLSAPNGPAQEAVIRRALAVAGLTPGDIDYVEAHGTGTMLGDPIELHALGGVHWGRPATDPLYVGSVKTNFGHTQAAAGVAGLMKVVLALAHETIPASLHCESPSPHIPWSELGVRVATKALPWKTGDRTRRAGVSSFGISGTNAHVVLEEAPTPIATPATAPRPLELVVLSAKTPRALDAAAERLRALVQSQTDLALGDIAFSLATTRAHHENRVALVVASRDALSEALDAVARGETPVGAVRDQVRRSSKVAFLFTGQGSQVPGMGRGLYDAWPVFRTLMDRCFALFDAELERPLREVMWAAPGSADAALLDETGYTQPALFALEVALAELWRSWGVVPDAVAGHSIGEISAAFVAGVFTLEDACRLVAARGRLMQALPRRGAMVAIGAPEPEVAAMVSSHAAEVAIAALNGPSSVVISGSADAVRAIAADFGARGVRTKELPVSHAFHSPEMDAMLGPFLEVAKSLAYAKPRIPVVSNVSGAVAREELATAAYWVAQVRGTVRFADGVRALAALGATTFVELGPKATLLGMVPPCVPEAQPALVASLRMGSPEPASILEALGAWYAVGGAVTWPAVFPEAGRRVVLPTYSFERERHWVERAIEPPAAPSSKALDDRLDTSDAAALAHRFRTSAGLTPEEARIGEKIARALAEEQRRRRALDGNLYEVVWRERPRRDVTRARGRWLVVGGGEIGEALAATLAADGAICSLTSHGDRLERVGPSRFRLDASRADQIGELLALLRREGPLDAIVHVSSVEAPSGAELGLADLAPARSGLLGAVELVRAASKGDAPTALSFVTRGANPEVRGATGPVGLTGASLAAFARVVSLENPDWKMVVVDLPSTPEASDIGALAAELCDSEGEDQVALRAGVRFVPRITSYAPPSHAEPWRTRGTWLITGGFGAVGQHFARRLAQRGAEHIVLVGRRGVATPGARDVVASIESLGARAHAIAADGTVEADLAEVLRRIDAEWPPLRGVALAAGSGAWTMARDVTAQELDDVLPPKVAGAWLLHRLTKDRPLDAFVCFSSGASVWGGFLQASYAAANGFLDALVRERRRLGLAGLSVNYGPWAGMVPDDSILRCVEPRLRERAGVHVLEPEVMLDALEQLSAAGTTGATVAKFDWPEFRSAYDRQRPRKLVAEMEAPRRIDPDEERRALEEDAPSEALTPIQAEITEILTSVLKVKRLGLHTDWLRLGIHSLLLVEVLTKVNALYGIKLQPAALAAALTTARLAALVEAELIAQTDPAEVEQMLKEAVELSPAEFEALLGEEA